MNQVSTNEVFTSASRSAEAEARLDQLVEAEPVYVFNRADRWRKYGAAVMSVVALGILTSISVEKSQARTATGSTPEAVSLKSGDLTGPQVQFFDVVAADSPQTAVNPDVYSYISGVQKYANKNGKGIRVRAATVDGKYDVPLIRIDMTQAEIAAQKDYTPIFQSLTNKLQESEYNSGDKMNLAYLEGNTPLGCGAIATNIPNPARLAIVDTKPACSTGNTLEGFNYRDVLVLQDIIYTLKISDFVADDADTMASAVFRPNWIWYNSWINHSGLYENINSSPYFQHRLSVQNQKATGGKVTFLPPPDPCQEDCGYGDLYPGGMSVTVTAEAVLGYEFNGWQDCPPDLKGKPQEGPSCQVQINKDQQIRAAFEKLPPKIINLFAKIVGKGSLKGAGINCPPKCSTQKPEGTTQELKAIPTKHYKLSRLLGCTKVIRNICQVDLGSKDKTVTAVFAKNQKVIPPVTTS